MAKRTKAEVGVIMDMIILIGFGVLCLCVSAFTFTNASTSRTAFIPATVFLLIGLGCLGVVVYSLVKDRRERV